MKNHTYFQIFAPRGWHLLSCVIIPAAMLLIQAVSLNLWKQSLTPVIVILLAGYFILTDAWIFGGSCSKDGNRMEFLKFSVRGKNILRQSLIRDCLIRFSVMTLVIVLATAEERCFPTGLSEIGAPAAGELILFTIQRILTAYAMSALAILIERYLVQIIFYINFASWGMLFLSWIELAMTDSGQHPQAALLVSAAVCSVLFSVISVKNVMSKLRRSYYDKTVEI